ncbi:MAG: RlmE family RNA methyltransferase [Alphaproteobacteria bacterium]|nr:RlmE family RNA methyltransferase [Alphaproteobacteria bacterium]
MAKLVAGLGRHKGKKADKTPNKTQSIVPINHRAEAVRIKTASGRKVGSTRWLTRHFNDPYVQEAQKLGYRSRAAFKLLELEEKINLVAQAKFIIDLGSAPGGWLQIIRTINPHCLLIGCDLLPIDPMPDVIFIEGDFTDATIQKQILSYSNGQKPDLILSDMSPNLTGHKSTDFAKIGLLLEHTWQFTQNHLIKGGHFICKTRASGMETDLLKEIKAHFTHARHIKPKASRKETGEFYLVSMTAL